MGSMMGGSQPTMQSDLFINFQAAFTEVLTLAALTAVLAAGLVSVLISRQVVAPVQAMTAASQRIAEGHYEERVRVAGDIENKEQDELGMLAVSFNQMADRLERTEAMRRQLIGDITHELRTPLTTIKGSLEGLIDGVLPTEEETFMRIYQEADRLQHLVNDLQELSRVEAGAYELDIRTVPVDNLIDDVANRLERQFEEKNVSLIKSSPQEITQVKADADRIGQVLLNLVGNALQYTPPGGRVTIQAKIHRDEVHVSITDTGIGIPAEHLSHIFTRFYRVDKSRSRAGGGSGIGLTIAKYLVEAHGGRIWVHSEGEAKGSTFTFSLPAAG